MDLAAQEIRLSETKPDQTVETLSVAGAHSIAHLLPASRGRCGIYILVFANGDRYVGQAVDVAVRFAAHRRTYSDIAQVIFRRVPRAGLDAVEQAEIRRLEDAGVQLRNVVHTRGRLGASDFDIVVTPLEQQQWLTAVHSDDVGEDIRPDLPVLRRGNRARFGRLNADPRFADLVYGLRRYVAWTVPLPRRTELSYWSISAVPATNASRYPRLLTLSVHSLETLFVYAPAHDRTRTVIHVNVDLPTVLGRWESLDRLMDQMSGLVAYEARYRLRRGVLALEVEGARELVRLLALDAVVPAAQRLNLDLMRKGPAINWKTHCFDLADTLLEPAGDQPTVVDDRDADTLCEIGWGYDRRGDFSQAETYYRKALDADATNAAALIYLGGLHQERGEVDQAESLYRRAADAGDADAHIRLGSVQLLRGDLDGAEASFRQAIDAGHDEALHGLGLVYETRGELAQAEKLYGRAADTGDTEGLLSLGLRYERRGELELAESAYRQAVEAGDLDALLYLGNVYAERGDLAQAETAYNRALAAGDTRALVHLGFTYEERGDFDGAEEFFRRAVDSGDTDALFSLGLSHQRRGNLEGAERFYRQAANLGDTGALLNLGLILHERGNLDEAESYYRRVTDTGETDALLNLGILYADRGDLDQAEHFYRCAADAGDVNAFVNLGIMLQDRGDLDEAETFYRRAADAGDTEVLANLQDLYRRKRDRP